jgi:nitrous oxide reductase accessory protein NosL
MKTRPLATWLVAFGVAIVTLAIPAGADNPLAAVSLQTPDAMSRCPVCGMMVAPHMDWLGQIVTVNGDALFFDGAKDLFKFILDPDRMREAGVEADTAAIFVTSYYDRQPIQARTALFVTGSDLLGPMGAELIPHPTREAAEEFLRDHDGSAVLRFDEVTKEVLSTL